MKYRHFTLIFLLFNCWVFQIHSQVNEKAIPLSVIENLPAITNYIELPSVDKIPCKSKPKQKLAQHFQFAYPIQANLNPDNSGQWTETSSGRIWRLGVRSKNAYSLYINLHYNLLPGAKLFVYSPGYEDIHGAFTNINNNSTKVLSIAPVRGERIIIELNLPDSQHSFGEIRITKVYHDYFDIFRNTSLKRFGSSTLNKCYEDINCTNGKYWQTEKRSVCKIITAGGMGTGTLIGNTSGNSTPYILTASHLITSAEIAAEALFIFNFETTGCKGEPTATIQSLSGATLLSTTNNQVDFALMKLYELPPPSYQPFYAGWDARNLISQSGVCIHHPFGESKQIATELHPLVSEDIGEGFDTNSTWKILHWEIGTTELGSSGAPLFNEKHRMFGTMTGGRSTCGYPYDDYFTKFGVSWDSYPNPSNQLKYWLDSANTGQLVLDGYDPYGFNPVFCDTAWNFFTYDKIGLSNIGLTWGWISGHSSAGYTQFAERYESPGGVQVKGIYLNVAKAYSSDPLANIELKIWEGSEYPEKECYSELIFIRDIIPKKVNYIPFDTVLKKSGSFFVGYKINYKTESDTFAIYHAMDRGYNRPSSMYLFRDTWYRAEDPNALQINTSLGIGISECYGKTRNIPTNVLNVYPNPCSNSLTLDIPGGMVINTVRCFDSNARSMKISLKQTEEENKLYFNLSSGIYFLQIITSEKTFVARFVVMNE